MWCDFRYLLHAYSFFFFFLIFRRALPIPGPLEQKKKDKMQQLDARTVSPVQGILSALKKQWMGT